MTEYHSGETGVWGGTVSKDSDCSSKARPRAHATVVSLSLLVSFRA